jgi:hypothetical protein
MKTRIFIILVLAMLSLVTFSCDKKKSSHKDSLTTSQALSNYWTTQEDLSASMEARDSLMNQINLHINALGAKSDRNAYTEIDALVENYITQSEACAAQFDAMIRLEGAIIPYGSQNKGLFTSLCKGIYTKAKDTVVGSAHLVRSGWRVMSGSKSLRQVLRDPNSGIPIVSNFAEKMQQSNSARDAALREAILANNSHEGQVPIEDLAGTTPQEKLNTYLNLDDDDPIKLGARGRVMIWDDADRQRTAQTAKELGETGVKLVGDAYGGAPGEWVNEVIVQHQQEGQDADDKGTAKIKINEDAAGTPPVTSDRTIVISKRDMPDSDPRITIIEHAPQELIQQLPSGGYDFVVLADGYIRSTIENLQIAQGITEDLMSKLLKMADNAIVVEGIEADPETVFLGDVATIDVSCVSTIGQALTFTWDITPATYTNKTGSSTELRFKPTAEGTYTATVTIEDAMGNSKTKSIEIQALNAELSIESYQIIDETFVDTANLANPGETFTLNLNIKNNGTQDLNGIKRLVGTNGIEVEYLDNKEVIPAGQTVIWGARVIIPVNYSSETGLLNFYFDTLNAENQPVTINVPVEIPIDFYVEIAEVTTSPVIERVLSISGKIANPELATAIMFLDNDFEHPIQLNLNNGTFTQQIALSGSATEVQHTIKVIASSGSNEAEDTMNFTSLVPLTALRMTLTWDTPETDVDFWCTDPNGDRCWYVTDGTPSGLVLDFDDTTGWGPENITTTTIIPGDYLVQVHYYDDWGGEGSVGSNCAVVIRQNEGTTSETTTNYYGYLGATGDTWDVTTLHYDGRSWTYKGTVNKHSFISPKNLPAKTANK